jgi:hypothetical protein
MQIQQTGHYQTFVTFFTRSQMIIANSAQKDNKVCKFFFFFGPMRDILSLDIQSTPQENIRDIPN